MKNNAEVLEAGLAGAVQSATVAGCGAIVTGLGLTTVTVPNTILWGLITIGSTTTTVVAAPIVACFAVGGAIIGGLAAMSKCRRKQQELNEAIESYLKANPSYHFDAKQLQLKNDKKL